MREGIPYKTLKYEKLGDAEEIFSEIIVNKKYGFLRVAIISSFFGHISKTIDTNMNLYENFILIGDFNAESSEFSLCEFCDMYNLKNLIDEPTCYKNPNNPSSIDVNLTNRKRRFRNSTASETGLSDHHKMIITVLNGNMNKKYPVLFKY